MLLKVSDSQWLEAYGNFKIAMANCDNLEKLTPSLLLLQQQSQGDFMRYYKYLMLEHEFRLQKATK